MNEDKKYYIDTSSLLPYYREEKASRRIQELLSSIQPPVMISSLTKVEFASALARWIRMKEITEIEVNLIKNTFDNDIKSGLFIRHPLSSAHFRQAETWLLGRKSALRTLDALHLACSWSLGAELITCDNILQESADILGIKSRFI